MKNIKKPRESRIIIHQRVVPEKVVEVVSEPIVKPTETVALNES